MANEQAIQDIISESSKKSILDAQKNSEALNQTLQKTILLRKELNDSMVGARTMGDVNAIAERERMQQERGLRLVAQRQLAEERLAALRERNAQQQAQHQARQEASLERERQKVERLAASNGPYKQLSNQYNEAALRAQNLGAKIQLINNEIGPKTPAQVRLVKMLSSAYERAGNDAKNLHTQLLAIDQSVGRSQRNVGNYRSGFNGLSNSVQQLTREFPAFTYSVQTGFMALSNNIPIFFDQIRQTRMEIAALRAQGQQVPGLFKQLAASIFSWGTALSIGITLLTVYGKEIGEFITAIFNGKKALDSFAESQKVLGEALKQGDYAGAVKNITELRTNIELAKNGFIDKDNVVKQYNETIGKTTGEVKTLEQAEKKLAENADDYIKMTLYKAAAQLALQEAAKKAVEAQTELMKSGEEAASGFDKFKAAFTARPGNPALGIPQTEAATRKEIVKLLCLVFIEWQD